jgi:MPBQ/MSBQ methyltransferase
MTQLLSDASPAASFSIDTPLSVQKVYDGSGIYYQLLRAFGWGLLLNLGYSRFWDSFIYPFRADIGQERLVRQSIAHLQIQNDQQVLDVACGKGKSSFFIAMQNPTAQVTGLDLIERHIEIAKLLFEGTRNLSFVAGAAELLPFGDASFDRIHCLEAAFHFDRVQFLQEAYRVIKPGGRVVVVDFMWKDQASRQLLETPEGKLVKDLWHFEDLWTVEDYHQGAKQTGFRVVEQLDWSTPVSETSFKRVENLVRACRKPNSLQMLQKMHEPLKYFSNEDWQEIERCSLAHRPLQQASCYILLVLEKS